MEAPTPVSRYIPQNSKKRVFPGGSSSSGCKEVEVLEMAPPINRRTSKPKSLKQKEVMHHEIIDVDLEEDSDDLMILDSKIDKSGKGKKAISSYSTGLGLSILANDGSSSDIQKSNKATTDDPNSNLFYGEDEWIDTYYDDIVFDDNAFMQSQFDHMDIPPGVEAPFPWLPNSQPKNTKVVPTTSTSTYSSSQLHASSKSIKIKDKPTLVIDPKTGGSRTRKMSSKWLESGAYLKKCTSSSGKAHLSSESSKIGKTRKKSGGPHVYSSPHSHFSSGSTNLSSSYSGLDIPMHMIEPSLVMNEVPFVPSVPDSAKKQNCGPSSNRTSAPGRKEKRNADEILKNLADFKQFDTVEDYSDHHYAKQGSSAKQPPKNWAKRVQEEWKSLEKDLPDTIFVRVYESRMDLLRAVIVGAEGTPYHDGLFFFDVLFPSTYPNIPPKVHYHSGGLRINPNLYDCGKVCLSLLNTWPGGQKEKWIPGASTMLQVLVSIQGLILNAKPYFNEPGYARTSGTPSGKKSSLDYNERTFLHNLRTMVYSMRKPPKYFEPYVVGHYYKNARDILVSCKAYMEGAQVGCLVKGGVQDVDEGDKSCSLFFKTSLAGFITTLVNAFSGIGAKDCKEFLSLAQKANNGPATAASRAFNPYI